MKLRFSKMHGLGNDFVVFDAINQQVKLSKQQLRFIADRHFGIGCDQILLVEPPRSEGADFHYRIFNADGAEVEQCGNGARCFARFVRDQGLSHQDRIRAGTASGDIELFLQDDGQVRVNMGAPKLQPRAIPFVAEQQQTVYDIMANGKSWQIGVISMGNPHAVLVVDDEVAITSLTEVVLIEHGYRVFVAHDGLQALNILIIEKILRFEGLPNFSQ